MSFEMWFMLNAIKLAAWSILMLNLKYLWIRKVTVEVKNGG